jgi:hypothetical protein
VVQEGRQHYNVTLGILSLAGVAFALQQTAALRRSSARRSRSS